MMMNFDDDHIERRHGALVKFTCNILLGIVHYIQRTMKFILYFALHFVDVLEAAIGVILQIFRVVKVAIKALFTFGILLRFVEQSLGAEGTFLLALSLLTYICFWTDSFLVSAISYILPVKVYKVCVCVCVITVPVGGLLVFVRLRRKVRQQIDLLVNYEKLYEISKYVDKSTETVIELQPVVSGQDYDGQWVSGKEPFSFTEASDLSQRQDSSSGDETDKNKDTGFLSGDMAESEKSKKSVQTMNLRRKKKHR